MSICELTNPCRTVRGDILLGVRLIPELLVGSPVCLLCFQFIVEQLVSLGKIISLFGQGLDSADSLFQLSKQLAILGGPGHDFTTQPC